MQHEYTAQQLDHAMGASHDITGDDDILEVSFEGIRAFLDALPEPDPQDDWEACEFADIRKGDRVKEVVDQGGGTYEITEGVAHIKAPGSGGYLAWKPRGMVYQLALEDYANDSHKVALYRIPAPVEHPDPAECPVIIVHKALAYDFTQTPDGGQAMMWNGDTYENADYEFFCKDITDWTPAKVVADND